MYQKIICPKCGYEYTISEIFIPQYLLGKPRNIIRDDLGRIEVYDGIEQDLTEEYTCDKCNTTFNVNATITFETTINEAKTEDDYVSTIYENRLVLDEQ